MPANPEFTGERFLPGLAGEIAFEHNHRYAFARRFVAGRRVLDVACGEGYGAALLAEVGASVTGIDIDVDTIARASQTYARKNLRFTVGSAAALPLPDASVDAVVSFETIEHLPAAEQPRMLAEFARVLAPDGIVILSSPNRPQYSDARNHRNPFHLHELDGEELARLLGQFPAQRWYHQRRYLGDALWAEREGSGFEALCGDAHVVQAAEPPQAMYFVVIAARSAQALPPQAPALSLFGDADEREWARIEAQIREVIRLDGLLGERDAALARQTAHILHLEQLVADRDRVLAERDAQLASERVAGDALRNDASSARAELASARQAVDALEAERKRLESALAAQDRIIAYRQSARWWVQLPWLRVRHVWRRLSP
jgi:ubiquinone/menaquinone biosynthesis C-methylase UbiE